MESTSLAQADQLYRGFPDFSTWGELSSEDADLWSRFAASLEERRREASPETLKASVEVAVRAAALDTGAIEGLYSVDRGFTMTVALQSLTWEQAIEERGAGVRKLFEAQLAAYELVLDAVTQKLPITEAWIRALHERLCEPQKTYRVLTDVGWQEQDLPKGQYKSRPNHVRLTDGTFHAYAPVDRVADEMHRLIEQIRTPEFETAHPVLQASYCHYAFVVIHPFADGNGRVARALASTFFYRTQSIPLVIFENQRPAYLDSLRAADLGDFRPVVSFFRDRGIDTMQLVSESLMTAESPKPENLAEHIAKTAKAWKGLSNSEIEATAFRVLREIETIVEAKFAALQSLPLSVEVLTGGRSATPLRPGYKLATSSAHTRITLSGEVPQVKSAALEVFVFRSRRPSPFPFLIHAMSSKDDLEVRLEDVSPELTPHFLLRLDQWVKRQLGRMLEEIAKQESS
ncbi:MAG TPA: Fic family protein [Thermoanaerobaculia bacterium]|jgi:Fic family protein|nr:Fic family protein [Thermoanaerobaculia bacterium]